jgi:hypothetical protein
MPTIPYVKQTWTDGSSFASAARMGVLESGIFETSLAPAVRVYHNAAQSITNNTATVLAFNSERYDQAGGVASTQHDTATNNSRLTCRYAGIYSICANIEWLSSATGIRQLYLRLNGTTIIAQVYASSPGFSSQVVSTHYSLAVNDYVEAYVVQTSGGALSVGSAANYSPEFMMVRVA